MSADKKWTQLRTKLRGALRVTRKNLRDVLFDPLRTGLEYRETALCDARHWMDRIDSRKPRKPFLQVRPDAATGELLVSLVKPKPRKSDVVRKGTPQ